MAIAAAKLRSSMSCFKIFILLCSCFPSSFAILNPLDFLALQAIRSSLDDSPGSDFFLSWDFTADPCTFAGVLCDGDRVVALNLGSPTAASPGLTGRLDPAIGKLSSLAEFTLVPGRVMGRIPDTISSLTNLRFFAVSRNFLSGEIPAGFSQLTSLRTLDLSYNRLTGPIPGSLPALSNLILSHNRFNGSLPSFSSGSLTRVDLTHNDLSGLVPPNTFPPSLEYLSLSSNRFSGPVDRALTQLTNLNHLDLSMNRFTGIISGEIFRFPLTTLQLQRNQFVGPVQPFNPVRIPTVDLSYNRLGGGISPLFSTVQNLYLNNNRFAGAVPESFVDRLLDSTIRVLYLQHNYLSGMEVNPTAEIPSSSSMCMQYNCLAPPPQSSCPLKAGAQKTRPMSQCMELRGNVRHL